MPKLKTKSSAKKRFKITGTGKVMFFKACRRHGLSNRPKDMKLASRGGHIMFATDAANIKQFCLPNH